MELEHEEAELEVKGAGLEVGGSRTHTQGGNQPFEGV